MWRVDRNRRSSKSGERVDFKFSNFQAIQVPKGWDKLLVSIISVETGKTNVKSNKALVKNGNCQWAESLSESLWFYHDDASKELEEHLFKLVVSMGSARSGILGEATVNMTRYLSSRASKLVSLPLKKCNYGTILQVQIQCLNPKTKFRVEGSRSSDSDAENQLVDDDEGTKSNASVVSVTRSIKSAMSPSSQDLGSPSHPEKIETSYSAAGSDHITDSEEDSSEKEKLYPKMNRNEVNNNLETGQDSKSSGLAHHNYSVGEPSISNHSSFKSRITHSGDDLQNHEQESDQSQSLTNADSSKNLLEVAEDAIEELRDEAKMWERNARKLTLDLDILREKFCDQSKKLADVGLELSAAQNECDGMKKEIDLTKLLLEESTMEQKATAGSTFQAEGASYIQKELEKEIKFQEESNAAMALQLKRSQESNIELLCILQELEETIEKQKEELEDLPVIKLKVSELETSIEGYLEEKRHLLLELQQLQESEQTLQSSMHILEQSLSETNSKLEKERSSNRKSLFDLEREYRNLLSVKEEDIISLEEKLSDYLTEREETQVNQMRETEALNRKVQKLERDCSELTDENLELLCKFKESKKVIEENQLTASETSKLFSEISKQLQAAFHQVKKPWHNVSSYVTDECTTCLENLKNMIVGTDLTASNFLAESVVMCFSDLNRLLEVRIGECEELLRNGDLQIEERNQTIEESQKQLEDYSLKLRKLDSSKIELEATIRDMQKEMAKDRAEMAEDRVEVEKLKADLLSKKEEIEFLRRGRMELEAQVSDLTKEKDQLQENMEIALRESNITSKCLDDLRNDLMVLSSSVESHASANKILERKSLELQKGKREVELHLFEVEEENVQLLERISAMDTQLAHVTDAWEDSKLELDTSKAVATGLQDEIRRLGDEMETQERDLKQKLNDMDNQLSAVQEECANVKTENQKLQVSATSLIDECNTLQRSYEELRREKVEMQESCSQLESKLIRTRKSLSVASKRVEALEEKVICMLEEFALREKGLTSELESLRQENWKLNEKITLEESLLNQMYVEKTAEIGELGTEIERLTREVSTLNEERERKAAEAEQEVSGLRADRAKLESAVKEFQSRIELTEVELHKVQTESSSKIQSLTVELAAFKGNYEKLTADKAKLESAVEGFQSRVERTEDELHSIRTESKTKIQSLTDELAASVESYQKLTAEVAASKQSHDKRLKLLGGYRSREDKLKTAVNDLELRVTVSEYERQQLIEEAANLKLQLQKTTQLQDEVLALKRLLDESKFEKENLEASLQSIFGNYEDLKAEKMTFGDKISSLKQCMSELEESKDKRMALEEKLSRLESDLTAKEALYSQESEIRNELSRMKRGNLQYQLKIQQLEGEKDECMKRAKALEEDLKSLMEKQDQSSSTSRSEKGNNSGNRDGNPYDEMDYVAKIELLEAELDEALNANSKYRSQLQRASSEGRNNSLVGRSPRKVKGGQVGEVVGKERTKSSLETELKELRERYLQMSLKYAEVEAEREDLVMKLKTNKSGKRGSKSNLHIVE